MIPPTDLWPADQVINVVNDAGVQGHDDVGVTRQNSTRPSTQIKYLDRIGIGCHGDEAVVCS